MDDRWRTYNKRCGSPIPIQCPGQKCTPEKAATFSFKKYYPTVQMMIVVLIIVALAALFTVIYINRPQFAKEGESCDSSSKGCAENLECINNVCSIKFDDRYELFSNTTCEGNAELTTNPSLAATGSIEDFAKIVSKKCDEAADCKAFILFKDPQPGETLYWKTGISIKCDNNAEGNPDIYPQKGPLTDLYRKKAA